MKQQQQQGLQQQVSYLAFSTVCNSVPDGDLTSFFTLLQQQNFTERKISLRIEIKIHSEIRQWSRFAV
jgi:hypothetical protein